MIKKFAALVLGLASLFLVLPLKAFSQEPESYQEEIADTNPTYEVTSPENGITEDAAVILNVEVPDSVEITLPNYEPWEMVTLEGKLKMEGLPLTPTLKIFMQKDSLIDVSIRAPFFGEVGKLIMAGDSVTVINKMNKTYNKSGGIRWLRPEIENENARGIGIRDIQELLLGRFFLPGFDVDEVDVEDLTEIIVEDSQINVLPIGDAVIPGIQYAYAVDDFFNPLMLVIIPENENGIEFDVVYTRKLKGYDMEFMANLGSKRMDAIIEFKDPEWKGDLPKTIDLKKYKETGIEGVMRY